MPFCKDVAEFSQAAALGFASYRPRVKLWLLQEPALNFDRVARVRMLWSSRVPEQKVQDRPVRQPAKSAMTV